MSEIYKILISRRFKKNYLAELNHSIKENGKTHAKEYFEKIDKKINSLCAWRLETARGINRDYRIINSIQGVHILYHIDEASRTITLIDIVGTKKFHELIGYISTQRNTSH